MDAPEQVNESRMIDVNTATAEEIEALSEFIKTKMFSSDEWQGRAKHAENMAGRPQRPARVAAEMEADEGFAAASEAAEGEEGDVVEIH
jgi:hypothetical protein